MAGKRETFIRDRQRNSAARKITVKRLMAEQKQQAGVLQQLIDQAKAASKK